MAEFLTGVIDPPHLLGYVRANMILQPPTLESILPTIDVPDIAYALDQFNQALVELATYRAWDTVPRLGRRPGYGQIKGELAPLGLRYRLNETEVKRLNRLRQGNTGVNVSISPESQTAIDRIYNDALNAGNGVLAREEAARADLLVDGIVTVVENGVNATVNFGVPGTNIVTAAVAWTDRVNAVPLTDLYAWQEVYRVANGGRLPDAWLISRTRAADFELNAQVRNALAYAGTVPAFVSIDEINRVLSSRGIAPIVVFNGYLPDAAGAAVLTLPANKVIGVRQGMGNTLRTTTAAADLMVTRGLIVPSVAPGLITYVQEEISPVSITTTAEAVSLPVLRDPAALFVATV